MLDSRFPAPRTMTVGSGPALPDADGRDPNATTAGYKAAAQARIQTASQPGDQGAPPKAVVVAMYVVDSSGGERASATVTYRLYLYDRSSTRFFLLDGTDQTWTQGTSTPRLLTNVPAGCDIYVRCTATSATAGDTVEVYVGQG